MWELWIVQTKKRVEQCAFSLFPSHWHRESAAIECVWTYFSLHHFLFLIVQRKCYAWPQFYGCNGIRRPLISKPHSNRWNILNNFIEWLRPQQSFDETTQYRWMNNWFYNRTAEGQNSFMLLAANLKWRGKGTKSLILSEQFQIPRC